MYVSTFSIHKSIIINIFTIYSQYAPGLWRLTTDKTKVRLSDRIIIPGRINRRLIKRTEQNVYYPPIATRDVDFSSITKRLSLRPVISTVFTWSSKSDLAIVFGWTWITNVSCTWPLLSLKKKLNNYSWRPYFSIIFQLQCTIKILLLGIEFVIYIKSNMLTPNLESEFVYHVKILRYKQMRTFTETYL